MNELSANLGKLGESVAALTATVSRLEDLRTTLDEIKEATQYNREVLSMVEDTLKKSKSFIEEEEEEE